MNKRTKKILAVSGIIAVILAVIMLALIIIDENYGLFADIETYPEEVEMNKAIQTSYEEIDSEKWTLNGAYIYDEEHSPMFDAGYNSKEIKIPFEIKEGSMDESVLESISEIYKSLAPTIRECLGNEYASYPLVFIFRKSYRGELIRVTCTNNCNTIQIEFDGEKISIKDIVRVFPELNELVGDRDSIKYDSIEEIAGFKDLQMLDLHIKLPEEEKEYILSLYPDCEIVEESSYKMKE